ncbi:hypothetical protein EH221_04485 [bacterium]|nr:MAG: hypothetical protein EH221_04485 [bacterium]
MKKISVALMLIFVLVSLITVQAGKKNQCDKYLVNYQAVKNGGQSYLEYPGLKFQEAWMAMLQAVSGSKYTLQTSSKEDGMIVADYELSSHSRTCTVFILENPDSTKISIKIIAKIKPGNLVGYVRDKSNICDLFKAFEENAGITN